MCRSATENHCFLQRERHRLMFRAFYLRLSVSIPKNAIPQTLTLVYPPRINGALLEINGAKIRPDSSAYVVLHRVRSAEKFLDAVFTSTDRVRAGEGARFEVYLREEKVLKGIFRRDEEDVWKVECQCSMGRRLEISEAEVCVEGKKCGVLTERVEMAARWRNRRRFFGLEEIPEEKEIDFDGCDCGEMDTQSGGEDFLEEEEDRRADMEEELGLEGVRWAVDLGIWVMCLGVGILVSRASTKADFWKHQSRRKLI